ncbi:MAG TPA: Asp-tRNA(Asn)/Glu-tRNA(Gln) amidotransferase subunit GatB [Burkholderiales bacterium]|nr:Asp-tRNA(Asn)/Glu-tRNA(Gln) amidotransferase subunit GatB [Burkholderiales bacterium]
MSWEIVIGLETHAQLSTRSKMFSGAATAFGGAPNTQASAVDIALPGVLPVANKGAVERAIRFGLAVGATVHRMSIFARKHYFYPDLPKSYQISQYEAPIVQGGTIAILTESGEKRIRLTRAHLEEDAGKLLHEDFQGMSGIDFNRAGVPLLEIVSEPDLRSAAEAVAYARAVHSLVRWIDICDGNMQEGSFRCDANVSVRLWGETKLGTRCEIKNLNSFRFLQHAIEHEARRQIEVLEGGGSIIQETRLYDPDRDETRSMRTKEDAHDYRYFPDPDLLPLAVSEEWIGEIRSRMPESAEAKRDRYRTELGLSMDEAVTLTQSREMAEYFEGVLRSLRSLAHGNVDDKVLARAAATWVTGEVSGALNKAELEIGGSPVRADQLAQVIWLVLGSKVPSRTHAREVFARMWEYEQSDRLAGSATSSVSRPAAGVSAEQIARDLGFDQVMDAGAVEAIVAEVLAANPKQVEDYRAGKEKAFNSLVGQVMKATKGKANPAQVNELLRKKLAG